MEQDYWDIDDILAENQRASRTDIITIQQPRAYGPRVRAALDASAPAVRLRDLVPYWYAMALRLANLLESQDMHEWLERTYLARVPRIFELSVLLGRSSSASNAVAAARTEDTGGLTVEMQEFLQGLDESEVLCAF
ncbi:DNA replication protein [Malassezia caprae]|uniref:DNA replication complex GINS protein PSF3 n=1 Tax=Malassezia caprae TaxID=1381934 RepID=A0AAF0E618_9BASI|nr:DNA replication protein [Malassezia caprae]